jgi:DNA-binding LacI/PurR family transcriptional regulator
MAAEMARQLLMQIERPETPTAAIIFDPTLVVRQSA